MTIHIFLSDFCRKKHTPYKGKFAYQGSNSWMMLSNRITANKREENPEIHANNKTVNVIKLFHPDEFDIDDFI